MAKLLWTQRQDIGASRRVNHCLTYQDQRETTLLFGGESGGALLGDTWEWDGETWTQTEDVGPVPRASHRLAYDTALQRVVLFGGKGGAAFLGDTWEWNGEAWTQVEDTGPSARHQHALAYDRSRQRIVLFGGESPFGTPLGDTWEWNGDQWTQVEDTGPSARSGHAMTRRSAVDVRREALGQLRGVIVTAPDQLREQLRRLPVGRLLERCSRLRRSSSASSDELATRIVLRSLARRIEAATLEASQLEHES